MTALIQGFITTVDRARIHVRTIRRDTRGTSNTGLADLCAVAPCTIAAQLIERHADAGVCRLVAGIERAANAVIAGNGGAGLATLNHVADFHAIAKLPVVATRMVRGKDTRISVLVAGIRRASNAVVAIGSGSGLATHANHANLLAIAEEAVLARRLVGRVDANVLGLIA